MTKNVHTGSTPIPTRYLRQFLRFVFIYCKEDNNHNRHVVLERRGRTIQGKPVYRSLAFSKCKQRPKTYFLAPYLEQEFSSAAIDALAKRGLLSVVRHDVGDGTFYECAVLTVNGLHAAIIKTRQDAVAERRRREKRRRDHQAYLRSNLAHDLETDVFFDFDSPTVAETFLEPMEAYLEACRV